MAHIPRTMPLSDHEYDHVQSHSPPISLNASHLATLVPPRRSCGKGGVVAPSHGWSRNRVCVACFLGRSKVKMMRGNERKNSSRTIIVFGIIRSKPFLAVAFNSYPFVFLPFFLLFLCLSSFVLSLCYHRLLCLSCDKLPSAGYRIHLVYHRPTGK